MATSIEVYTVDGFTVDQFIDNRCRCMRLLAAGAAIDQIDCDGWSEVIYTTWNFRLTEILVDFGTNVKILNTSHISALHFASERNNVDVVELLLGRGADIDANNAFGLTPLHLACNILRPAIVELFLHQFADIDIVAFYCGKLLFSWHCLSPPLRIVWLCCS